ncbi:hypothetical protein BDQ17DRAFT_1352581 [Cyathus striatus]|nr:hypothetical protein BDQ17DRAFT_1352581 [Cyathus striatus]
MNDFPVELLVKIFLELPYTSLLHVSGVCRLWNEVLLRDPILLRQLFRPICPHFTGREDLVWKDTYIAEPHPSVEVKLHPVLRKVSYRLGEDLYSAGFQIETPTEASPHFYSLSDLSVARDYVSIPVVTDVSIEIAPHIPAVTYIPKSALSLKVNIRNPEGVRVIDIFTAIATESNLKCDLLSLMSGGTFYQPIRTGRKMILAKKAELLGSYRKYSNLSSAIINGRHLTAQMFTLASRSELHPFSCLNI